MKENEIRAVELVRSIRDRSYEETQGLSDAELQEFIAREAHQPCVLRETVRPHATERDSVGRIHPR